MTLARKSALIVTAFVGSFLIPAMPKLFDRGFVYALVFLSAGLLIVAYVLVTDDHASNANGFYSDTGMNLGGISFVSGLALSFALIWVFQII